MINDLWYKNAIIYSLSVETYMDSNGDGVGDLQGLTRRLDYLAGLGITAIWLMPFQPSPQRDNGYDISDYYGVDPRYGTLGDFVEFAHGCKQRGIRLLIDLVVNHTSDQHPWFQAARRDPASPFRNWYVWSKKKPANSEDGIVFPGVQTSTWTRDAVAKEFYFHRFYDFQPDLDTANPEVQAEILKIMGFWLQLGVSGFRMDAVPFVIATKGADVTTPVASWVPIALRSARTGFITARDPIAAPAIRSECPPTYLVKLYSEMSAPCWIGRWKTGPSIVLSHAMTGVWSCRRPISLAIRRIIARSTTLFVGFAGVSTRIIVGFTAGDDPVAPPIAEGPYGFEHVNVAVQRRAPESQLNWVERIVRMRKEVPEVGWGTFEVLDAGNKAVLAMRYDWRNAAVVFVHNLSGEPLEVRFASGKERECARTPMQWSSEKHGHYLPFNPPESAAARVSAIQSTGAGSTFSFDIAGGQEAAFRFLNALQIIKLAVSLGGTESLASLPASMTHSGVPAEVRLRMGVLESTIRVSIGIEHPDDLVADLAQALAAA